MNTKLIRQLADIAKVVSKALTGLADALEEEK